MVDRPAEMLEDSPRYGGVLLVTVHHEWQFSLGCLSGEATNRRIHEPYTPLARATADGDGPLTQDDASALRLGRS